MSCDQTKSLFLDQRPLNSIEYPTLESAIKDQFSIFCECYRDHFKCEYSKSETSDLNEILKIFVNGCFYDWEGGCGRPRDWCQFYIHNDGVSVLVENEC